MRLANFRPLVLGCVLAFGACGDDTRNGFEPQPDPAIGATSFVSATSPIGDDYRGPGTEVPTDQNDGSGDDRTIEEGDIYRVLDAGRLLNLNAYRGLQVIDVSNPAAPTVVGSLRMAGSPVELYVVGDHAVVLMNDWYGYWGSRYAPELGKEQGGAALLVDLSDPTNPTVVDRAVVAGSIMKSRLTRGSETALYVAAALWQMYDDGGTTVAVGSSERTIVQSFAVDGDALVAKSQIDLGGWVSDIQGTPSALLVARTDWSDYQSTPESKVAVIDITAPDGTMVAGPDIAVAGQVKGQFNLDLRGHVLRVVSEGFWGEDRTNHLETFDVSEVAMPVAVDHETFGPNESLYATLFVGDDKAFFVTYLRQDPFHAFHIDADGEATAMAEFVVSGWNDFFAPVFGDQRLVGVGIDDAGGGRALAVSLYDIASLTNPEPLLARATIALEWSWSEASWDHRAFSVLEDAVAVNAADGTPETGLVLLPYSGWTDGDYTSGVRLFTFSPTTMTARGALVHDEPVRRGFLVGDDTAACLSDTQLGLHDVSDPDAPAMLGRLALAPNYAELLVFGDHGLRHAETAGWSWWGTGHTPPPGRAEVVALSDDPDTATALASFEVPPGASLTRVGDLAVVMTSSWVYDGTNPNGGVWTTTITTWDLTNPLTPIERGTLMTTALQPWWGNYYGGPYPVDDARGAPAESDAAMCYGCYGWTSTPRGTVVGDALVFFESVTESEPAGQRTYCTTTPPGGETGDDPTEPTEPTWPVGPDDAADERGDHTWYTGNIWCTRDDGGPDTCYGAIYACSGLEVDCVVVEDPEAIGATTECWTQPTLRYWVRWIVHVLDLHDATAPTLLAPIDLPTAEEGVGVVADGDTLWVTTREPYDMPDDTRAYVRYWARPIDLSNASAPDVGQRVNVPGALIAVDGADLYSVDYIYDADHVESAVSRCALSGGVAMLVARKRFDDRQVQTTLLDGAGHVLVSHGPVSWWYGPAVDDDVVATETYESQLTLLDAADLDALATVPTDTWADLRWAGTGRALFQVPGGLLVMNTEDASNPWPQAWFATAGWPSELVVDGTKVYFAAGLYGLYTFDVDTFNLLAPVE